MIDRLEDVRAGDLFLGPIGGAAGIGVRLGQLIVDGGWKVGPLNVQHIGVVVEPSRKLGPAFKLATGQYVEIPQDIPADKVFHPVGATRYTGVITAPLLAQAMPGGAEIIKMRYDTHWTKRCAFARIPEDWPGQAGDAAAIARLMAERQIGYSWPSYPALAAYRIGYKAPRLTEWIGRRGDPVTLDRWSNGLEGHPRGGQLPVEAICSVFADQAWSLAGKRVMTDVHPMAVTPSQLGQRLLFEMDGVEWGWPQRRGGEFVLG